MSGWDEIWNDETVRRQAFQRSAREAAIQARQSRRRARAAEIRKTIRCNCDLDNWEPEAETGHSHVCRIHKAVMAESIL